MSRYSRPSIGCFLLGIATTALPQDFTDVTNQAAFAAPYARVSPSGGTAVADFNRDGWPDVFTTGDLAANTLLLNQANGAFVRSPLSHALELAGAGCGSTAAADYDNDGWPDLYIACAQRNYLFRNDRGRAFVDVTDLLDANHGRNTQAVAWADIDGDGRLDLVLGVHEPNGGPPPPQRETWDQLMLNRGVNGFENLSHVFNPTQSVKKTLALVVTDIDGDGDPDIYFVNDKFDGNSLWRNDGPGCNGWCFADISASSGADRPADGMGVAVGDYDRDLDLDIFYSGSGEQILLQNQKAQAGHPTAFVEVPVEAGASVQTTGWGVVFLDADNDGWEDLFVAGSGIDPTDFLLSNQKDGSFSHNGTGLTHDLWTYSAARLDYDRDGRLDLLLGHPDGDYRLYRNISDTGNHWLVLRLEAGGGVNRDGIGSRARVTTPDGAVQMKELRAGASRGVSHQPILHFGLGQFDRAEVDLFWPDGSEQSLGHIPGNRYHHVVYAPIEIVHIDGFE